MNFPEQIELIDTGYFYADGGIMFGCVPKSTWQRRYTVDENNRCVLAMRTALIRYPNGRVVLVDVGVSKRHIEKLKFYGFFKCQDLGEILLQKGITVDKVTDVILTHLHFDHCGYCAQPLSDGSFIPTFPKAKYWVSKRQWDNFLSPHPLEKDSYFKEDMECIYQQGLLFLTEGSQTICEGLQLLEVDGHTPGQLVPIITTEKQTSIFAGDLIPLAANLSPSWISAYDLEPQQSYDAKCKILAQAEQQKQEIIFCHDAFVDRSFIKAVGNSYKCIR